MRSSIMQYLEFVEKLRKLEEELHFKSIIVKENNLDVAEFEELTQEDRAFVFESLQRRYSLKLPLELTEILIPGPLHICWHYSINQTKRTGGEFNLTGTPSLLINTAKTAFQDELTAYGKQLYSQGYRFFDSHPYAGDAEVFALLLDGETITSHVWHIDLTTKDELPLEIDYFQYIEHSLTLKGVYGWQYLFEEIDFKSMDVDMSGLGRRLEDYPQLFPGTDVKDYVKRYKDRGGE